MESVDRSSAPRVQLNVRLPSTAERSHRLSSHVTKSLDSPGRFRSRASGLVKGQIWSQLKIAEVCSYEAARIHGVSNLKTCS